MTINATVIATYRRSSTFTASARGLGRREGHDGSGIRRDDGQRKPFSAFFTRIAETFATLLRDPGENA
jgi:hypothetical protein